MLTGRVLLLMRTKYAITDVLPGQALPVEIGPKTFAINCFRLKNKLFYFYFTAGRV